MTPSPAREPRNLRWIDLAIAAGAGLFIALLWNYTQFIAGGVSAIAYFVLIIITTGPQYIGLLKRVFHVS